MDIRIKDIAWSLDRLNLSTDAVINKIKIPYPEEQTMPSWKSTNAVITEEKVPVKKIAFLPVLPYPCTEYSTVYTAMKNFVSLCNQLEQDKIPMYCDEKVYCIVKEIRFIRKEEFSSIIPCLGTFHTIKTLMKSIGKSLGGSGAESVTTGYGPTVIDKPILGATHYNRALEGLSVLAESISRLIFKEFFEDKDMHEHDFEIQQIALMRKHVSEKNTGQSLIYLNNFASNKKFYNDFRNFLIARSELNENFKYWLSFVKRMEVVYDLLRADREGNWLLHLVAFECSLHQFAAWDCTNYLRWGSVYLEDMRLLQETSKTVYENFMEGSFSIKDGFQKFTAVGGDEKLEQTINLATKRSDSVIGNARKKHFIAKWDMIYHEMLSLKTLYSEYAMVNTI